ncbi:MAG: glycosyltransferase family 2 protein, partial [Chloroflexia bacterium]|nr:glycosyltransferase family 2 protein [Chloroflexia bacterium]
YVAAVVFDLTNPALATSWFAPVLSALMVLTGVQLMSAWSLARVLAELSRRDAEMEADLNWTYVPAAHPVHADAVAQQI